MSKNIQPTKIFEMSKEDHNKALDLATEIMKEAILNDEVESRVNEIKVLFWGMDALTDDEINDIYEMAQMEIEEGL